MTGGPACARCGRVVPLCFATAQGRVCSNCRAILKAEQCACCGEVRRVASRGGDGRAVCGTCLSRQRRVARDAESRRRIIEAVSRSEPGLDAEVIESALDTAVSSARSLRRLATHIDDNAEVFTVGPTSTLPALDRLTETLVAAGAKRIATIDPICDACQRRRRRKASTPTGGLCSTCLSRTFKAPCSLCGITRRYGRRDDDGQPVCDRCADQSRRRQRLDQFAGGIVAMIRDVQPAADEGLIVAALDSVAPNEPDRAALAESLRKGEPLSSPARRDARVARLIAALREAGFAVPAGLCQDCAGPAEPLAVYKGVVRCAPCAIRCPDCGADSKGPTDPRCGRCTRDGRRPHGTCRGCDRRDQPLDGNRRCRNCRERDGRRCGDCDDTAPLTLSRDRWVCHRCALGAEYDQWVCPTDELPAGLAKLRAAVMAADNPAQLRKWLRDTVGGQVLQQLAAGRVVLTHDTLDAYGRSASVDHLRALLVSVDALSDEDRSIDRFDAFASELINTITDGEDPKVLRAWTRWQVLPRLRRRAASGASMAHSANNARRALRQSVAFVNELHRRGHNLRTATQTDLDNWFGQRDAIRWLTRPFLAWAQRRGHLASALEIPPQAPRQPRAPIDVEQRWTIGRRLVIDNTLDTGDRVAAALVVLYGQPLARIASLTRTDLHRSSDGTIVLNLAGHPVPIHEPFASLIEQLPARRRNGVADQLDSPWLFPGSHAGRPVSSNVLGQRLRRLGIEPALMRNAARSQLAAEIPSALLGEIIGISPTTATRWTTQASGNWAAYAAGATST